MRTNLDLMLPLLRTGRQAGPRGGASATVQPGRQAGVQPGRQAGAQPGRQAGAQPEASAAPSPRLLGVAREFEALLVEQMVREMRRTVPKTGLMGDSPGQELFNEMLDGEYVRLMTQNGGIGLGDYLAKLLAEQGLDR